MQRFNKGFNSVYPQFTFLPPLHPDDDDDYDAVSTSILRFPVIRIFNRFGHLLLNLHRVFYLDQECPYPVRSRPHSTFSYSMR